LETYYELPLIYKSDILPAQDQMCNASMKTLEDLNSAVNFKKAAINYLWFTY